MNSVIYVGKDKIVTDSHLHNTYKLWRVAELNNIRTLEVDIEICVSFAFAQMETIQ